MTKARTYKRIETVVKALEYASDDDLETLKTEFKKAEFKQWDNANYIYDPIDQLWLPLIYGHIVCEVGAGLEYFVMDPEVFADLYNPWRKEDDPYTKLAKWILANVPNVDQAAKPVDVAIKLMEKALRS